VKGEGWRMIPVTVLTDEGEFLFARETLAISHLFSLALVHHEYTSLTNLKVNLTVAADAIIELFMFERERQKGSSKAFCTRTIKRMVFFQEKVLECETKGKLIYSTYAMVLALEGLGLLRGFGVTNRFHDSLRGDPERTSLREIDTLVKHI
jgi:hypothetical protein